MDDKSADDIFPNMLKGLKEKFESWKEEKAQLLMQIAEIPMLRKELESANKSLELARSSTSMMSRIELLERQNAQLTTMLSHRDTELALLNERIANFNINEIESWFHRAAGRYGIKSSTKLTNVMSALEDAIRKDKSK
jgi:hypothetical protein